MKTLVEKFKSLKRGIVKWGARLGLTCGLFTLGQGLALAQQLSGTSFTPLYTAPTNAWTYVQPTTPVGTLFIPSVQIQVTTAAFTQSNTVTIPFNIGLDPLMSNYPITLAIFTNSVSNGIVTITTAATNINLYGQAILKMTNTITGQVGAQVK